MFEVNNQLFFSEHARNNCPRVASLHTNTVTSSLKQPSSPWRLRTLIFSRMSLLILTHEFVTSLTGISVSVRSQANSDCKKAAYIILHFCPLYPHLTNRPKHFIGNAIIIPCSPEYSSSNILSNASTSINYVPGSNIFWYTACNKMSSPYKFRIQGNMLSSQ